MCLVLYCLGLDLSYWASEVSTHLQNDGELRVTFLFNSKVF